MFQVSLDLYFDIGQMILETRILKGITQKELAEMVGTKQPSIARIESGSSLPSLSFLKKIADALDTELISPKFAVLEGKEFRIDIKSHETGQANHQSLLIDSLSRTRIYFANIGAYETKQFNRVN